MAINNHSPYSASVTGAGFLQEEFDRILPLFRSSDSKSLSNQELEQKDLLQINSLNTRKRAMSEFTKRFQSCSAEFWDYYSATSGTARRLAYFFVLLKTYRILFDLHMRVTVKRWLASENTISLENLRQEFDEIAAQDDFVSTWSDMTLKKIQSSYLSILRKVGFLEADENHLQQVSLNADDFCFFIEHEECWFLEACLLRQFEISRIKESLS